MKTQIYKPGLHDVEIKVRLTEEDAAMIKAVPREELRPDIFGHLPSSQSDTSPQAQGPERGSA